MNYRCKQGQLSSQVDRLKDAGSRMVKSFWWWGDDDDDFFEDSGEEVSFGATGSYTTADCVCSCILRFRHSGQVSIKTSSTDSLWLPKSCLC